MKNQKQFKRYIPICIKEKLDLLTYPRKDNLYVIIDLVQRKEIHYKTDLQKLYGFTEIALKQFKELLPSSDNLQKDLHFLIENGLILRNEYYTMGIKSKSYKIPSEYLGKLVSVIILNKNINRRIEKQIERYYKMKAKNLEFAKSEYFKTFQIDITGANKAILDKAMEELKALALISKLNLAEDEVTDIIECRNNYKKYRFLMGALDENKELNNILHRYMIYSTRVNAINDGFLFFKRNETNGRLDSNLTSLPSFLRPYIISPERLVHIDIKNSQPFFLYTLIKNKIGLNQEELIKYSGFVNSGLLYEFLNIKHEGLTGFIRTRKQIKEMLFKIFYSKNSSYQKYKQFFGELFPTIMGYINETNSVKHNTLAVQLQTIESFTVLDIVMPLLKEKGIIPFTIHDSFICKESEAELVKEVFITKLIELYAIAPSLHTNFLDNCEEDENDDSSEDWIEFLDISKECLTAKAA